MPEYVRQGVLESAGVAIQREWRRLQEIFRKASLALVEKILAGYPLVPPALKRLPVLSAEFLARITVRSMSATLLKAPPKADRKRSEWGQCT